MAVATTLQRAELGRKHIVQTISGLLLAVFVVALSGTIVANALPRIIIDLGGSQSQYSWIVASTLLAMTATGPLWSKLADRMSKKLLIQLSLSTVLVSSILAGFSPTTEFLIGMRVLGGMGMGGLGPLIHIVMASLVSPRERGRYVGYFSAVAATATLSGPLLSGYIVDTSFLGWRWCFWIAAPIAVVAMVLLHRTLSVPASRHAGRIDWLGALLIPAGISVLLSWLTLAGNHFPWLSWQSIACAVTSLVLVISAVVVERRVPDPVLPPRLMGQRTIVLAIVASTSIGAATFGCSVLFAQYFQIARGHSPTEAGLLALPMVTGLVLSSIVLGKLVTFTGRWKAVLLTGTGLIAVALALLGSIDRHTQLTTVCLYIGLLGVGLGASMPTIMVAAQNSVRYRDLGAGTSVVMTFQSLGGATGLSILSSVIGAHVAGSVAQRINSEPGAEGAGNLDVGSLDLSAMPMQAQLIVADAYGEAIAFAFLIASVIGLLAFVATLLMPATPLRTSVMEQRSDHS